MKYKFVIALVALTLFSTLFAEVFGQKARKVKDKRFEPVVRQNLKDYEGTYVGIEPNYVIKIEITATGKLTVSDLEDGQRITLENIKLNGAHLTATKIYPGGTRGELDATFSNRILNGERTFGILVDGMHINLDGLSLKRIFYRLSR